MNCQYKIKLIEDVDPAWFGLVAQTSIDSCKTDGTSVLLRLPPHIHSVNDVPDEWKTTYTANEPYLNKEAAQAETADWADENQP